MDIHHTFELRSPTSWATTASYTTGEELTERLRALLDCDAGVRTFAVVFDTPVAPDVRARVNSVLLDRIRAEQAQYDPAVDWIDDLVDETGWQGVRATIDEALAPFFSVRPDDGDADKYHCAFWADERTFVHLELGELLFGWGWVGATSWTRRWTSIEHWHPGSMTSGSWSDELVAIDLGDGPVALLEVRGADEDRHYWTVTPLPQGTAAAARTIAGFLSGRALFGFEQVVLGLIAHGLPVDGTATDFPVDLFVADNWNEGYEISGLHIEAPDDVVAALRTIGTLDADAARALRDHMIAYATGRLGPGTVEDLWPAWRNVLAQLDEVAR